MIKPLNREVLRGRFQSAQPFPFVVMDDFLEPEAVAEIAAAYPTFEEAQRRGFTFNFVNEQKKVQITDAGAFPESVRRLNEAISAPSFLADVEYITGIPRILSDEKLVGGGMHLTGAGGRLDVHVDFNVLEGRELFRRLNILLYLNPVWDEAWGGQIELWDAKVKNRHHSFLPSLNRCLIFETSERSYHGVAPVTAPPHVTRRSFAAYYYTRDAAPGWQGRSHSTIFRARPNEKFRGLVQMPLEKLRRGLSAGVEGSKRRMKSWIGLR